MANYLSTQMTALAARPIVKLGVQEVGGRLRAIPFDYIVPAGGLAAADTIDLCEVPAGARMIGGSLAFPIAGAARTMTLGDGTTADKYSDAIDISAGGAADFAEYLSNCNECGTSWPRTKSATSRAFRGPIRIKRAFAVTSIAISTPSTARYQCVGRSTFF